MKAFTKLLAIATVAFGLAVPASAAVVLNGGDLSFGDSGLGNSFLAPGETYKVEYTATEDLLVLDLVSFSSVGFSGGSDLELVNFGYEGSSIADASGLYQNDDLTQNGATTEANGALSGFALLAGESFSLFFTYDDDGKLDTSNQFSFQTAELNQPPVVPLPAAGWMLIAAIGGLGYAGHRKKA